MTTSLTPSAAWHEMQRGNEHFVSGKPKHPRQDVERRAELLHGQNPLAAIFGCSDSRLSAEIIFDKGLGDLFVVRNAGHVISNSTLGSLEYAVEILHIPLIIVLGHDDCGAVRAAIDSQNPATTPLPPNIHRLIQKIVPAVQQVSSSTVNASDVNPRDVEKEHLRNTVVTLIKNSEIISNAISESTLAIIGAQYSLREGHITTNVTIGL